MKRTILIFLCAALMLTTALPALAADGGADKAAEEVIESFYSAIDRQAWSEIPGLYHSLVREDEEGFVNNPEFQEQNLGIFNVTSAKLLKLYEADPKDPCVYPIVFGDELRFGDKLKVYLSAVEFTVKSENAYTRNGLAYHLEVLAWEDGQWKYAESSGADADMLKKLVPQEDFTDDTRKIIEIYELDLHQGITVNLDGKIIAINSADMAPYNNFSSHKNFTYAPGHFSDIDESQWYGAEGQKVVAKVFEYGLVCGKGDKQFDPDGALSLAEAIKIACVVHNIYNGGDISFSQSTPWYQEYIDYAVKNGIIKQDDFGGDYNRAATRAEAAYIFSGAVSRKGLPQINDIKPSDVSPDTPYADNIILLYNAGILCGDGNGFAPGSSLSRAEACALVSRLILPTERVYEFKSI